MKKHHGRRLLKLADRIEILPRKRFIIHSWVGEGWNGSSGFSCGTSACAMGWATTMPEFRRLGLRLTPLGNPILAEEEGKIQTPQWGCSLRAIRHVFGSEAQTEELFIPLDQRIRIHYRPIRIDDRPARRDNPTPRAMAVRIRKFVEKHLGASFVQSQQMAGR